jgi:hypothetical protein
MTDFELIAAAKERLLVKEAGARAAGNKKELAALLRLHKALEKAMAAYALRTGGDVVAFSGGTPKEIPG